MDINVLNYEISIATREGLGILMYNMTGKRGRGERERERNIFQGAILLIRPEFQLYYTHFIKLALKMADALAVRDLSKQEVSNHCLTTVFKKCSYEGKDGL